MRNSPFDGQMVARRLAAGSRFQNYLYHVETEMTPTALVVVALGLAGSVDLTATPFTTGSKVTLSPDIENTWTPVAFLVFDSCLGEFLVVSGQAHVTTRTFDEGERLRIKGHTNLNVTGIGLTTGVAVHMQQVSNSDFEMEAPSGAGQSDQVFHLNVVSAGNAPNSQITTNGTMYFDGQGGTQFVAKKAESVCR